MTEPKIQHTEAVIDYEKIALEILSTVEGFSSSCPLFARIEAVADIIREARSHTPTRATTE